MACFNGDYPVAFDDQFDKLIMEKRAVKARLLEPPSERLVLKTPRKQKAYAAAGVDVDLGNKVKKESTPL
jgi:hypothetical protein